jgi:hypothetical protein
MMRLLSYTFPLVALLATTIATAQSESPEYSYEVLVNEMTDNLQEKRFWEAMRDLEPHGRYSTEQHLGRAELHISLSIDSADLAGYLEPYGFTLAAFTPLHGELYPPPPGPEEPIEDGDMLGSFPQYIDTGDRWEDNLYYRAAKEAWLRANPAEGMRRPQVEPTED